MLGFLFWFHLGQIQAFPFCARARLQMARMQDQPTLVVLPEVITTPFQDVNTCTHTVECIEGVAT